MNQYLVPEINEELFINHSCMPNAYVDLSARPTLTALRDIIQGEEICFDYAATETDAAYEMYCNCREHGCRRIIRSWAYLPLETKKKYRLLGIVPDYINR